MLTFMQYTCSPMPLRTQSTAVSRYITGMSGAISFAYAPASALEYIRSPSASPQERNNAPINAANISVSLTHCSAINLMSPRRRRAAASDSSGISREAAAATTDDGKNMSGNVMPCRTP